MSMDKIRLPHGVRDFLPGEADSLHALRRLLLAALDARGYRRVVTPSFEYLDVLARGTGETDERIFKFVEPSTGEVLALRPDITPQVARMVATALQATPPPVRLHYFGSVFRLEGSHSGVRRELFQVGAECFGVAGPEGDAEVIVLLAEALSAVGLDDFSVDLGHMGILRSLLQQADVSAQQAGPLCKALRRKDRAAVARACADLNMATPVRQVVEQLPELYGGIELLDRAPALLEAAGSHEALTELIAVCASLEAAGMGEKISLDLGEVRGFGYHSGTVFQAFVRGVGRPLGGGGRYDGLTARYGRSLVATGFALDLVVVLEAIALIAAQRGN